MIIFIVTLNSGGSKNNCTEGYGRVKFENLQSQILERSFLAECRHSSKAFLFVKEIKGSKTTSRTKEEEMETTRGETPRNF